MSISTALGNAMSGLTASSRAAEMVSNNVANAMTEGYSRRELVLNARIVGGAGQGVSVGGVRRVVDEALLADRRHAGAAAGERQVLAAFQAEVEAAIGVTDAPGALGSRVAALETALIEAASRPEAQVRLENVAGAARALAATLSTIGRSVQDARARADAGIARDVGVVNTALKRIAGMNTQIMAASAGGGDATGLMDQRQRLIDTVAQIVPLRETKGDNGAVGLYSTGGAVLLDGSPAVLSFTATGFMTPDMTLASGALSGITLRGAAIDMAGRPALLGGGTLAAQFAVRDDAAPQAQAALDALARDLVERFAAPGLDPTRGAGAPGLFTDAGAAFDPANTEGLAQRLTLNAAADGTQGGAAWRLRDGLGATGPGAAGNTALLTGWRDAMTQLRTPASGTGGAQSLSGLAANLLSGAASARLTAESEASYAAARSESLRVREMQNGVDTDREMQDLLVIERSYAANAKVMQAVDLMVQTLLEM